MIHPKTKSFFIFFIFSTNILFAQKAERQINFNSYFPIANLDSLEQVLLKTPKNTLTYTDLLLKYEHSHLLMHDVHSRYTAELIMQAKKETNLGRKAMFDFLFGWSKISPEAESQIISIHKALSHFEAVSDTAGMVNAYAILVWLNSGPSGAPESALRSERYLDKMANLASKSTDLGVQVLYVFYKNGFESSSQVKESFEQREWQLQLFINKIKAAPAYFPYLKLLLNVKGVLYRKAGKNTLALKYYMSMYHQPNQQSFSYLLNLCNIGKAYNKLGKNELAKPYFEKVIAKIDINNDELLYAYQAAYVGLGKTLEKSNPVQATKYFQKAYTLGIKLQQLKDHRRFNDIQAILEQDQAEKHIKTLSAENLRIEVQNLKIKLLLGFVLLLLLGISLLAFRFYKFNIRLEKITQSRNKLFAIISHDLRSPLSAYMGMAESVNYLLKTKKFDRILELSQQMDLNAQKIDVLMTNLFQWSMAEREHIKPSLEMQDIIEDIKPTLEVYQSLAKLKNINLQITLPEQLNFLTDKNLIMTIVRNLLDNALKFCSPNGSVSISIEKSENYALLKLSNDFSSENPLHFKNIEQLINNNRKFTYGEQGMGMGLLLVKEFADSLKIKINFRTEKQKAIFELLLPIHVS